jgi:2-oxo-4-hydroxy-4-carboxy-5-ureidoimidazoline decarboxylase
MSATTTSEAVPLSLFNEDEALARQILSACLDVPRWVDEVAAGRPYAAVDALRAAGTAVAETVTWDEAAGALDRHPRIGERQAAAGQGPGESAWSRREQSGVGAADLDALAAGNRAYEERFGHLFLICATGLSGSEIRTALDERLTHSPEAERPVVVSELRKIAAVRLAKAVRA